MTDSADLTIPDAAADGWFACGCSESGCVRAGYDPDVVALIVAAELRRQAEAVRWEAGQPDGVEAKTAILFAVSARLDARAAELDGKGD